MLSLIVLPLAIAYYDNNKVKDESTSQIAWGAAYILLPSSIMLLMTLFMNVKKEYRKTFWSAMKSKDFILKYFESDEDETKSFVFISNIRYWKEIENEVEEWVGKNWTKWMEEKPEWLNDNIKARIPPHMIPNIRDRKVVEDLQIRKRKTTLLGRVSGRSRSSFVGAKKVAPDAKYAISTYTTNK